MTRPSLALSLLALLAVPRLAAQQPDSLPALRSLRLRTDTLRIVAPPELIGAGRLAGPRLPVSVIAGRWIDSLRSRVAAASAARWGSALASEGGADTAQARPAVHAPAAPEAGPPGAAPGAAAGERTTPHQAAIILSQYADLGLALNARFELKLDRLRNLRCTAGEVTSIASGCRGGLGLPRIDPQFDVRTGGVVGERVHLNVDYDSEREFSASNNINVYYQGLEDEIVRRVEVGNVTLTTPGSRFITGGIPANNFGLQVQGQLGALDWGAIIAQQRGNVVRDRVFTIGERSVQPLDRELADRDFETGRFFFVVDPAELPGYPAVDALGLSLESVPPPLRVRQVRLYRLRGTTGRTGTNPNLGGIPAVAVSADGEQRVGPFRWELLNEGRDYYLDPSGLWLALANRLDQEDFLAVSYVTAAGQRVGSFPAVDSGRVEELRLVSEPRRGPDAQTFRYEMRNAYRVGATSDVLRQSVRLTIVVAESERPATGSGTFLDLLGLAQANDVSRFDQFNRLFPRERDPSGGAPLRDYYIIFPHLAPLADSSRLGQAFRNDSLYRTPSYLLRTQGPTPLYALRLAYDAQGGGDRGVLSLGGFQIREGTEKITVGGRLLERTRDYTISYEIGQVSFNAPDTLFRQPTQVVVQYEEQPAFAIAPTSIYGLQGRYDLGDYGGVTFIGLLQRERTTFTRPPLGFEPASSFVGGISGSFRFEPGRLTRLLDALPLIRTNAPSRLTLDAEIATSRPSPNQVGVAYVETFESEGGSFIALGENAWQLGSRPSSAQGLAGAGLGALTDFRDQDAAPLTWQSLIGNFVDQRGQLFIWNARTIDPSIVLQGAGETAEAVLWLTLHPDTAAGLPDPQTGRLRWVVPHTPGPRWRSITQALSATGADLSRVEFVEFWVFEDTRLKAREAGASLVLDFGTVYEDAVDFAPESSSFRVIRRDPAPPDTVFVFSGIRRAGEGRLDTERDTVTGAFNAAIHDVGILGDVADSILDADNERQVTRLALCRSELGQRVVVYEWGDRRARCTNRNGALDTEDLNGDSHLDRLVSRRGEQFFRYVLRLGAPRYYVRDGFNIEDTASGGGGRWRLYRIPFRTDTVATVGSPSIRLVQHLRLTVVVPEGAGSEAPVQFALARVKLVGAPWVKRADTPIRGLHGSRGTGRGEVVASVISTENRADLGYEPPPGVFDEGGDRSGRFQLGAVQINERSLRLIGRGVEAGERAEAFLRFSEGERNFLGYRELRIWARGRGPGWDEGELRYYVKVAKDENNFYLYRAPASSVSWEPEGVVDFERWLALRAAVESRFLRSEPPSAAAAAECGGAGDPLAYVACEPAGPDWRYLVHVRNPGVAPPNLTRVQELAVGFVRDSGAAADSVELWVDDIRLARVVDDAGFAGALALRLTAADVGDLAVSMTRRDAQFRQLGEDPSYVTSNQFALASTVRLERLGLERLGLIAPLSVRLDRSGQDPFYLSRTDVRADALTGLRRPSTSATSYGLSLRRSVRGQRWWERALVDNLGFAGTMTTAVSSTELSEASSRTFDLRGDYNVVVGERSFRYVPGFLVRLLRSLPPFVRRAEFVRALESGRLRWTPAQLRVSSNRSRFRAERNTFRVPIATVEDSLRTTVLSFASSWRNEADLQLRPLRSTSAEIGVQSTRDLRDYGDTTTLGVIAQQARRQLLGLDVGFERDRAVRSRASYEPTLTSWLRPRASFSSSFTLSRDPNARLPERTAGDSAGGFRLPESFSNSRSASLGLNLDVGRLVRGVVADTARWGRVLGMVSPIDMAFQSDRRSQFDRVGRSPPLSYQLGLGGVDAFRSLEGRLANAASDQQSLRFASGLRLPLNLSLTGVYSSRRLTAWSRRGAAQSELRQSDRDWPSVTARWSYSPRQAWLRRFVTNANATAQITERRGESVQPPLAAEAGGPATGESEVRTLQRTRDAPFSLSLTWAPRIVTALGYGRRSTEDRRSGNFTLTDRADSRADVSFAFRLPPWLFALPSEIRTKLGFVGVNSRSCIQRAGTEECIRISESSRVVYNLTMDTDLPPTLSAGLQLGYVLSEAAHANRKSSQFMLTASVTVQFSAGEIR